MNYPLISEYIEAIKSAEDNFEELTNLRPVLTDDGQPVMTSGNFAVVFKVQDKNTGKFHALKCFTKEQEGREEAYHQIAEELKDVDSPYLVSIQYLDKELFVDTDQTTETEFPILLMDWIEGKTLDKYLRENLDDKYALEMLAYRFSQLAQWLIPQPFAHGDLKPDNILVREDGTLVLVDYDGMYVPAMKGQKARELGSPDFRHPKRFTNKPTYRWPWGNVDLAGEEFNEHIDDFPLFSILLSLKAVSLKPQLLEEFGTSDRLLFSEEDYMCFYNSKIGKAIESLSYNREYNICYYIFQRLLNSTAYTIGTDNIRHLCFDIPNLFINKVTYIEESEWKEKVRNGIADYNKDGKKLLRVIDYDVSNGSDETCETYTVPVYRIKKGTITICDNALRDCKNLRHIFIPSSVKYIGEKAFYGCYFRYIELHKNIEYIHENAFENCLYLKTIIIPEGTLKRFSVMLPNNIAQLRETNIAEIKSIISSYLDKQKNKGLSYWETLKAIVNNICDFFDYPPFGFYCDSNYKYGHINSSIGEDYYNVNNIDDNKEIVNAICSFLLDTQSVDMFQFRNNHRFWGGN